MVVLTCLFWLAVLTLACEMERYELRQRSALALPGALLVALAAACALWTIGGALR